MINKFKALALLIVLITLSITAVSGPNDEANKEPVDNTLMLDAQPGIKQLKAETPYFLMENRMLREAMDSIGKTPLNKLTTGQHSLLAEFGKAYGKLPQLDSALTSFERFYFKQQPKELLMSSQYQIDLYTLQLAILTKYLTRLSIEKYARHFLSPTQRRYLEILSVRMEIIVNAFGLDIIPIMEQTERSTEEHREYRRVTDPLDVKFREDTIKRQGYLMSRLVNLKREEANYQADVDDAHEIQRKKEAEAAVEKRATRLLRRLSVRACLSLFE